MDKEFVWATFGTFAVISVLFLYGLLVDAVSAGELKYGLVYDWIFFGFLLWFLYAMRNKFNQTITSYYLVMVAIVLHSAGAIFLYGLSLGWLQYDMFMHFYAGFALFNFSRRILFSDTLARSMPMLGFSAVLVALGLAGIHELIEFFSYGLWGHGPGLFTAGGDMVIDYVDVNTDLLAGFLGSLVGMLANLLRRD